jgi:hypothetical protein
MSEIDLTQKDADKLIALYIKSLSLKYVKR